MVNEAVSSLELPVPVVEVDFVKGIVSEVISEIELPKGKDGIDGRDGKDIEIEEVKSLVAEKVSEAVAALPVPKDGLDGKDGINGIDGKDAIDLEILPEIDLNETYVRNTYAEHNGGLWKSFEKTKGLRGWSCIVDGIKDVVIEQTDERKFSIKIERSSGIINESSFNIPSIIDKGVFSEGNEYEAGDGVSYAGSFWIAQKDTSERPNGEHTGWRLAVKRGRDGKDGITKNVIKNPVVKVK